MSRLSSERIAMSGKGVSCSHSPRQADGLQGLLAKAIALPAKVSRSRNSPYHPFRLHKGQEQNQ
jgi:hypothetical protein